MTSDLGDRERRTLSNPRIPDLRDPVTKRSNNNKKRTNKETKDKQKNITKKNGVKVNINCQFDGNQNPPVGERQTFGHTWRDSLNYGI